MCAYLCVLTCVFACVFACEFAYSFIQIIFIQIIDELFHTNYW
ncbi:hypothetical protein HMPREF1584_01483 [Gardnerella vaginalis JCP8481A]|nr:hypothetical protein HMPREF1584_01483 [Gardnerella vaginalis JCP8481A]